MTMLWTTRAARPDDGPSLAELRAIVLRADLERLGRFDERRVKRRFLDAFDPDMTTVIEVAGQRAGCIAVRPFDGGSLIEHFYLAPEIQGHGIGGRVLAETLHQSVGVHRLNVLQGSAAQRLYRRHGFVVEREDLIDVFMVRLPEH